MKTPRCVPQISPVPNDDRLSTKSLTHTKKFQPMKNSVGLHTQNLQPRKTDVGLHQNNFWPTKNHARHYTVPNYHNAHVAHPRTTNNVHNAHDSNSRARPNQRSKPRRYDRSDTDNRYLSHLKSLTTQQGNMKTPSIIKKMRNPIAKTDRPTPHKMSSQYKDVKYLTPALLEQRNIKLLIGEQRLRHQAKLHKRDAIIAVQTQFFSALRNLYTWPLDSLIMANIIEVRDFWELQLQTAKNCSYRAETIDPNHYGELRYDIMAEIVKLESIRITEFLETFQHFHDLMHDGDITDELRCDDQMLAFFTPTQTNVILAIPPQWIEETRRPPLTWYASLSQSKAIKVEGRILAPDYYESSGSNSS
jgi:hypothetical protein